MNKKLLFGLLFVCFISCSDNNSSSPALFRNIYNNSCWTDFQGQTYSFKPNKLFYIQDDELQQCFYIQTGTYNNVSYDACIYDTVTNSILSEDSSSLTIRQASSAGTGINCEPNVVTITFQIIDEGTIEVQTNYDGFQDSYFIYRIDPININGCLDATLNEFLW